MNGIVNPPDDNETHAKLFRKASDFEFRDNIT